MEGTETPHLCPMPEVLTTQWTPTSFPPSFPKLCQPKENDSGISEEESHGKTQGPLGWEVGKWCLQTDGDKQDLSVSNLDLIR